MKKRFESKFISYILIISFIFLAVILSLVYFNITGYAILGAHHDYTLKSCYGGSNANNICSVGADCPSGTCLDPVVAWWSLDEASGTRYSTGGSCGDAGSDCDLADGNTVGQDTTNKMEGSASANFIAADNEYLRCTSANCNELNIIGSITAGCWLRTPIANHNTGSVWMVKFASNSGYRLATGTSNSRITCLIGDGTDSQSHSSANSVLGDDVFTHTVCRYNNNVSEIRVFINGVLNGAQTTQQTMLNSSANFELSRSDNPAIDWQGQLDECFVANQTYTNQQICEICRFGLDGEESDRGSLCGNCDYGTPINPPSDTTPPVRSSGSPSGSLAAGTTQTYISLNTDEISTCRYSTNPGTSYSSMVNTFQTTGGMGHSQLITGLSNGQNYNYYVRCNDTSGNFNTNDFTISFSVSSIGQTCGNNLIEGSEQCDLTNLNGQTCITQGFGSGTLSCLTSCTFNTSNCIGSSTSGTTYYVSLSGDDNNPGTLAQPWKTIGKANQMLQAGDTVLIHAGTYNEHIRPINSGTNNTNRITYRPFGNGNVTLTSNGIGTRTASGALALGNLKYVTVNGNAPGDPQNVRSLIVKQLSTSSYGNMCGSEGVIVENTEMLPPLTQAANRGFSLCLSWWTDINISETKYNILRDNHIVGVSAPVWLSIPPTDYTEDLIDLSLGAHHNIVEGNNIEVATHSTLRSVDPTLNANIFRNNLVYNPEHGAINLYGAGRLLSEGSEYLIENNFLISSAKTISPNGTAGNALQLSSSGVIVRYNVLSESGEAVNPRERTAGLSTSAGTTGGGNMNINIYNRYYHNTIVKNRGVAMNQHDFGDAIAMGQHKYVNNFLYDSDSNRTGVKLVEYWDTRIDTNDRWIRNVFGNPGGSSQDVIITNRQGGSSLSQAITNLRNPQDPEFTSWNGFDNIYDNNISFIDYTNGNYYLSSDSQYIDSGSPLTTVIGSGSGTTLTVEDSRFFYGEASEFPNWMNVQNDWIAVGTDLASANKVQIVSINDTTNVLVLTNSISWSSGDFVWLWKDSDGTQLIYGDAPDIGAFEYCDNSTYNCSATETPPTLPICGNLIVESGEFCDDIFLNGQTCVTQGFDSGTLSCSASCTFDISGCTNIEDQSSGSGGGGGGGISKLKEAIEDVVDKIVEIVDDIISKESPEEKIDIDLENPQDQELSGGIRKQHSLTAVAIVSIIFVLLVFGLIYTAYVLWKRIISSEFSKGKKNKK
ncbi:DUF1565 domain-containing protein [Candidatus Woesearchaeota archaeon]|nr:DUF1565 domain-containing protein [Candidatus Woesearchaeota archaeon]